MGLLQLYSHYLNTRPLLTKMVSTFATVGLGDIISQYIESQQKAKPISEIYDPQRTLKMATFGGLYLGPLLHNWYGFLARTFVSPTVIITFTKVALDQTFFASTCICSFFISVPLMMGGTLDNGISKIKNNFVETLYMN